MMLAALLRYYHNVSELVTRLGGAKIYIAKAPTPQQNVAAVKIPYMILDAPIPNPRKKITQKFSEETGVVYIRVFHTDPIWITNTMSMLLRYTENLRGDLVGASDVHLTCKSPTLDESAGGLTVGILEIRYRLKWETVMPE